MKIFQALLLLTLIISSAAFAQKNNPVLLTIGDESITKDEFIAVYKKNNVDGEVMDQKSVEEYLDLYVKFKLKVQEAEALGMDTVQSFIKELGGYRDQLAQPYLIDEETNKALMEEAYERKKEDIRASHILLNVAKGASAEDTLAAYNKIMAIRDRILAGEDFGKVAAEVSEDPSARDRDVRGRIIPGNKGDLGYFTVFDMVYPFESAAYNTKEGEVSMPVRTDFGYHILKVSKRQPAMGKVQVAHILLKYEGEKTAEQQKQLEKKINEIYAEINDGKSFEDAAKEHSEDPGSAPKGGVLPWFGSNRMIPGFIDVVALLDEKGQISEPFETIFGWHIVKLIDTKPIGTYEEEKDDIKNRMARSDRSIKSTESLVKKVLDEYGYTEYETEKEDAYSAIDNTLFTGKLKIDNINRFQKPVCKIGDKKILQKEFLDFVLRTQERTKAGNLKAHIDEFYKNFIEEQAIAYEDSNLENKYPEFRLLMQEYRDGILLFDLMDEKIWSYAIQDTTGLKKYFEDHRANYVWKERANATIFTFTNDAAVKTARKMAKKGDSVDEILDAVNAGSALILTTETDKFEKGTNDILNAVKWETGVSKVIDHKGKPVFVNIYEFIQPQQKELKECRGLVISDYQKVLEEEWIKELQKKYTVSINKEILNSIK